MSSGRSAILTYHSLDDSGSVISISPAVFRQQMEFLAASEIAVVPLERVTKSPGAVAITFDDGFQNLAPHAIPVLESLGLPATIFVVGQYCGRRNNWPGQPRNGVPDLPLLSWEDLSMLPDVISLGAHTMTHPDLSRLSSGQCRREIHESKQLIEQRLGKPARSLAYPYGVSSRVVQAEAAKHFELAVGTSLQFLSTGSNRLDLPRIDAYYLRDWFPLQRLFTSSGSFYIHVRNSLRELRRLVA